MYCIQTFRYLLVISSLVFSVLVSACAEDDSSFFATQDQAIYHGSREPTVVDLSRGQKLAIGFLADPSGMEFCTGTLIDRDVVVTASHCTEGETATQIRFGVGNPQQPTALLRVAKVVEHSSLDAALLFLRDDAVSRVPGLEPLPFIRQALSREMVGGNVEAAGYGDTHDGSRGLFFVALTLTGIGEKEYDVDGHGQRGICFGDSGGPLLVSVHGDTLVAGVESWGDESCMDEDHLTRLDLAAGWIDNQQQSFDPNTTVETPAAAGDDSTQDSSSPFSDSEIDWSEPSSSEVDESGCSVSDRSGLDVGMLITLLVVSILVIPTSTRRRSQR